MGNVFFTFCKCKEFLVENKDCLEETPKGKKYVDQIRVSESIACVS